MKDIIAKILIDSLGRETVDKFVENENGDLARVETISLEALAEEIVDTLKKRGDDYISQVARTAPTVAAGLEEAEEKKREKQRLIRIINVGIDCADLPDATAMAIIDAGFRDANQTRKKFAGEIKKILHPDEWGTPDERWRPESEFALMVDELARTNDCPYQFRIAPNCFVCGKINNVKVPCPEMLDFRACGRYPFKMRDQIIEEQVKHDGGKNDEI